MLLAGSVWAQSFPGVLTWHNDNGRTGQNLSETSLTPDNVNVSTFGKVFSFPVDGQIFAQPLYVPSVVIPNQAMRNVIYVATENDSVYAFDADASSSTPLWHVNFTNIVNGISPVQCNSQNNCPIYPIIGITATPVIDSSSGTMYVLARTFELGSYVHRLHALDIATGTEKFGGPVLIQGSVPGTGTGSQGGTILFETSSLQRTALLLSNGVIYLGWAGGDHGWIMGYDAQTLAQTAISATTPNGALGGVWQAGAGFAADSLGNIYVATGDGLFDFNTSGVDGGDSVLKLDSDLNVVDYFTPMDQECRKQNDRDLGSGGPMVLPVQPGPYADLLVQIAKGGAPCDLFGTGYAAPIYLLNRVSLGHYSPLQDVDLQTVEGALRGYWSSPAYWKGPTATYLYFSGIASDTSGDYLKMYTLSNGRISSTPMAQTPNRFLVGSTPSVSADGSSNGILWAIARRDAFSIVPGVKHAILYAYDATNVATMLYSSAQAGARDEAGLNSKFLTPTVADGRVYVGTQNELDVYGLLGQTAPAPVVILSSADMNFGNQPVGSSSPAHSITLSNTGNATLRVSSISISGDANLTVTATSCPYSGGDVYQASHCTIDVVFTPAQAGTRTGKITITDNVLPPQLVSLAGTGSISSSVLSTNSVFFGEQAINTSGSVREIALTNTGTAALTINSLTLGGVTPEDFSVQQNCGTLPVILPSKAFCTISTTFTPVAAGAREATLTVSTSRTGLLSVEYAGVATTPGVSFRPSTIGFGSAFVGTASGIHSTTLTNVGDAALNISSIIATGDYSLAATATSCSYSGGNLVPGSYCTLDIIFSPTKIGTRSGSVIVSAKNLARQVVGLSGDGATPTVILNPATLRFGKTQLVGTKSSSAITLTNSTNAILTPSFAIIGKDSADFTQTNNCASVPAWHSCTITIIFYPADAGELTASLQATDTGLNSPQSVPMVGTATALELLPASLTFGSQPLGTSSSPQAVTITNLSKTLIVSFTSITTTGVSAGDFAIAPGSNACGGSLSPGADCTVSVTFTPSAKGARSAMLTVNDNGGASPQTAKLSGTGT